jgi:pSer/pThr/pTyr-binding forkhead associated (FHA) protein
MKLEIEVFLGPSMVGQKFTVSGGSSIGRTKGTVNISDPKISGLHAKVEATPEGGLILVDGGSSNGIKVDGNQVDRVPLELGTRFQLGRTTFIVVRRIENEDEPSKHEALLTVSSVAPGGFSTKPLDPTGEKEVEAPPPPPPSPEDWRNYLNFMIPQLSSRDLFNENGALAFVPPVRLVVIAGIQADQEFILGFGPRRAGAGGVDISLKEESCPEIAFEISPSPNGPRFSTEHPNLVFLNNSSTSGEVLSEGDTIRVGKSVIQVNFVAGERH